MNWKASRTSAIVDQQPTVATVANNQQPTVSTAAENFYAIFCSKIRKKKYLWLSEALSTLSRHNTTWQGLPPSPLPHVKKKIISVEWIPRIRNQRDATYTYMIKIIHRQLVINIIGAIILHKNFPVLKCYEDFYIELDCPLPVG